MQFRDLIITFRKSFTRAFSFFIRYNDPTKHASIVKLILSVFI